MCVCAKVDKLWKDLCPLIRTALTNITVETYTDWGTCIATACVSCSHAYKYTTCNISQGSIRKVWDWSLYSLYEKTLKIRYLKINKTNIWVKIGF